MVPKLLANSLIENRELRRQQLVDAALSLALESDISKVTITSVAKRAGISRAAVYEYFSSSSDLITDLLMDEMENYANRLAASVAGIDDPWLQVEKWISEALMYIADGRHMLVKSLSTVTPPDFRKEEVAQGHREMMATIYAPITNLNFPDSRAAAALLQSTIDATAIRIDSGNDVEKEVQQALSYALAGLKALLK